MFSVAKIQRESDHCFLVFIRTYARFWGFWKMTIALFSLKTTARKWRGAKMEHFWSTFYNFWAIFCKKWAVFCKNRKKWNGFWQFWKRESRFRAEAVIEPRRPRRREDFLQDWQDKRDRINHEWHELHEFLDRIHRINGIELATNRTNSHEFLDRIHRIKVVFFIYIAESWRLIADG